MTNLTYVTSLFLEGPYVHIPIRPWLKVTNEVPLFQRILKLTFLQSLTKVQHYAKSKKWRHMNNIDEYAKCKVVTENVSTHILYLSPCMHVCLWIRNRQGRVEMIGCSKETEDGVFYLFFKRGLYGFILVVLRLLLRKKCNEQEILNALCKVRQNCALL